MPEELEVFKKLAEAEVTPDFSVPFTGNYEADQQIVEHKAWLKTIRHEQPSPRRHYRVGIYIRYFNQTKHDNYLEYHIRQYQDKSILPELRVIDSGVLKGFVTINPRWAGFKEADYMNAAQSVYIEDDNVPSESQEPEEMTIQVEAGDFDLRGFEITRTEFFGGYTYPTVTFQDRKIKFSTECIKKFGTKNFVELLINPVEMKFAVRPTDASNRNGVLISKTCGGRPKPRDIPSAAFSDTVFSLFGWNTECKYRMTGFLFEGEGELAYIFDAKDSEAFFKSYVLPTKESGEGGASSVQPLTPSGKHIRAIPAQWTHTFGKEFYLHEQPFSSLASMTKSDWELRIKGQLFETGKKLNVTGFDELKQYITHELGGVMPQEVSNGNLE